MSKDFYIKGGTAYVDGESSVADPLIKISGGKIASIIAHGTPHAESDVYHAQANDVILPGFIDIHIHGANGADVMDGHTDALQTMADFLPREGVTSFLGTTITSEPAKTEQALKAAAGYASDSGAELLGIHLEGPFISQKFAGAQHHDFITPPDVELFKQWQNLSGNRIRVVTFAPEEPDGQRFMKHLSETNVIGSVGHSNATYSDLQAAAEKGLTHATHLFNAMRPLHHREPGVVGSVYLNKRMNAELILDGIHVDRDVAELTHRILGSDRLILITDAIRGKGLEEGTYDLGGQEVTIRNGEARLADGTLAGSVLTMDAGVRNALSFENITWSDIVKMTSFNAAESLRIDDRKGRIAGGYDADLVIMSHDGYVRKTFCRGDEQ